MSTVELGSGTNPRTASRDELVFRSDIDQLITRASAELERRLQQYINGRMPAAPERPVVNVTTPTPAVTVTPTFSPRFEPIIDVEVPGIAALTSEIAQLRADLNTLLTVLMKPVTRTPQRDSDGTIIRVVESR